MRRIIAFAVAFLATLVIALMPVLDIGGAQPSGAESETGTLETAPTSAPSYEFDVLSGLQKAQPTCD